MRQSLVQYAVVIISLTHIINRGSTSPHDILHVTRLNAVCARDFVIHMHRSDRTHLNGAGRAARAGPGCGFSDRPAPLRGSSVLGRQCPGDRVTCPPRGSRLVQREPRWQQPVHLHGRGGWGRGKSESVIISLSFRWLHIRGSAAAAPSVAGLPHAVSQRPADPLPTPGRRAPAQWSPAQRGVARPRAGDSLFTYLAGDSPARRRGEAIGPPPRLKGR